MATKQEIEHAVLSQLPSTKPLQSLSQVWTVVSGDSCWIVPAVGPLSVGHLWFGWGSKCLFITILPKPGVVRFETLIFYYSYLNTLLCALWKVCLLL